MFAIRHAESVANMIWKSSEDRYYRYRFVNDIENPCTERLRDCLLTRQGVEATLERAKLFTDEVVSTGHRNVLLVVSPLSRAMMTTAFLFHKFSEAGVYTHTVLEPAAVEEVYSPHDIIENIGRPPN